jgi:exopolysaccharide biosynthesis WecB/TagA/CpsF family protein
LCEAAADAGLPIFLLGGRPGVAAAAAEWACGRFEGLQIAGIRDGYFDAASEAEVIGEINRSQARILLVGMGAPRQDTWLRSVAQRLAVPVRIGVGGLFDYYSGRIPRAPVWIRELGLEWVWRIACEPGRLWRRYIVGNPLFLYRVLIERIRVPAPNSAAHAIGFTSSWRRHLAVARLRLLNWLPGARMSAGRSAKRLLDVVASLSAILLLSPVLGLVALAIRLESSGPVIFRQRRVGRDGREFMMLKFRSMFTDAEQRLEALLAQNEMDGGVIFKMRDDPRVTRVGRLIRRTSIDELPQLFNVLRGDMSLVGPRPPLPREVALYSLHDRGRLDAEPGITCIWQVSGRSTIPFERQVEMDLDYIHSQSLVQDIKLLLRTVPALLLGRGAY